MATTFKNSLADRGKKAEEAVKKALANWEKASSDREVERLLDTRAAGRTVKAAAADFAFYSGGAHGLIEVKSTEHEFRLARPNITQLPRMRKRELCGGVCLVLVHHSTLNLWRVATVEYLSTTGDKGSWNLMDLRTYETPGNALASASDLFSDMLDDGGRTLYCHYCRTHKPSAGFKVITHLMSGTKRYRCPDCNATRSDEKALADKVQRDQEVRAGAQATRVLLAKEANKKRRTKESP
jgi:hypothetical protein